MKRTAPRWKPGRAGCFSTAGLRPCLPGTGCRPGRLDRAPRPARIRSEPVAVALSRATGRACRLFRRAGKAALPPAQVSVVGHLGPLLVKVEAQLLRLDHDIHPQGQRRQLSPLLVAGGIVEQYGFGKIFVRPRAGGAVAAPAGASPCFFAVLAMPSNVGTMSALHLPQMQGHSAFTVVKAVFGLQPFRSINCRASSGSTGHPDTNVITPCACPVTSQRLYALTLASRPGRAPWPEHRSERGCSRAACHRADRRTDLPQPARPRPARHGRRLRPGHLPLA